MAFRFAQCNWDFNRANVKLDNGGAVGLGTGKNVSGTSNSSLQQQCDGMYFSILLFEFFALKEPATELRLLYMLGQKYVNKILLLFSGSENAEVSLNWTFESRELSTPAEDFSKFNLPSRPDFQSLLPPFLWEFQNPIYWGVWIFPETTHLSKPDRRHKNAHNFGSHGDILMKKKVSESLLILLMQYML